MKLDAGPPPLPVEAGQEVAGDVLTAHRAVGGVDLADRARGAGPGLVRLDRAVRNREPGLPSGRELAGAAGEVAQTGREATAGGDRGGDEAREAVEAAGRDDALVHGEARAPPEYAPA